MEKCVKVCVTGGAGYIASILIKHLLGRGYTVHSTLRNLSDASKVGLLKNLPNAETRLKLFEADIYRPHEFAAAIEGCVFVFHLATPWQQYEGESQNTSEAAVGGVKMIAECCIKSNTVKKLIYTATVLSASPLKDGCSDYKTMDESCWTPLDITYENFRDYIPSKTLAEKEVLSYNGKGIEVVSLATGVVGGDTLQSFMPEGMSILLSQALIEKLWYKALRALEELLSKVPIVHVQDVIEAHIFSAENPNINGRFLCASAFLKSSEIASLIRKHHPEVTILPECIEDTKRETRWGSKKLEDMGFQYKYDADKIIDDSIRTAKRLGSIV